MADVSQLLESRRLRLGRWAGAALVVVGLHVGGGALAVMHWPEDEDDDAAAGALSVELAPLPAAMPVKSEAAAVGPDADAAELTPEATKKVVEEVQKDFPQVDPSPAPKPEVALPKPQPEKEKPRQEEPQEALPETQKPPVTEAAPLTTRQQRVEAQPAPTSAPALGQSASLARLQASWQRGLIGKLNRFKRYPDAASRRGVKGVTVVRFRVDRSGQVIASQVVKSSGSEVLDEEALALLKRASPLPAPPAAVADEMLDNFLPIYFGMKPNG
ncbi:MAG TPA: energy transducer TonB [Hyphomicrobiaceae bacterium]|jgi:protein TonB